MIEGGKDFGLALGTNYPVRVAGEGFWKELQRDVTGKARVSRAIHLTHPARTNRAQDLVGSHPSSGGRRHLAILHGLKLPAAPNGISVRAQRPATNSEGFTVFSCHHTRFGRVIAFYRKRAFRKKCARARCSGALSITLFGSYPLTRDRTIPNGLSTRTRTSFAFQDHLWTMKPFGGSLAISTDALEKESQNKDAPSRSSRPPEACANESEATISR